MSAAQETVALVRPADSHVSRPVDSPLSIEEIIARKKLVTQCVKELMQPGEHYGTIPGTARRDEHGNVLPPRQVLLKPGADLLCSLFQLEADYVTEEAIRQPDFIYYRLKCVLTSASTGIRRGSGLGSCNSREEKYARPAARKCPECNRETILRSKPRNRQEEANPDAMGWFCWAKKGGCGRTFPADDPGVIQQDIGVKDPSDLDNTILKMAAKRARVDAILTVTGASDFFTQDVEDLEGKEAEYIPPSKANSPPKAQGPAATSGASRPASGAATTTAGETRSSAPTHGTDLPHADKVIHDGELLTAAQLQKLQILRREAGGTYCGDDGDDKSLWRMKVLGAYRTQAGERITSSKQLSKKQASHLIERLTRHIAKTQARAAEMPDIGAAFSTPAPDMTELAAQMTDKGIPEDDLCGFFGKDSITSLDRAEAGHALALVLAWDTDRWPEVRDSVRDAIEARQ